MWGAGSERLWRKAAESAEQGKSEGVFHFSTQHTHRGHTPRGCPGPGLAVSPSRVGDLVTLGCTFLAGGTHGSGAGAERCSQHLAAPLAQTPGILSVNPVSTPWGERRGQEHCEPIADTSPLFCRPLPSSIEWLCFDSCLCCCLCLQSWAPGQGPPGKMRPSRGVVRVGPGRQSSWDRSLGVEATRAGSWAGGLRGRRLAGLQGLSQWRILPQVGKPLAPPWGWVRVLSVGWVGLPCEPRECPGLYISLV